ncbi:MAG: DNA cytosine methyltransferase [Pauljensenia sp.]
MATYGVKLERSDSLELGRHPEAPAAEDLIEWCKAEKKVGKLLAVDLFAGAGGLGVGLEAAGWTVAIAVDNNEVALKTHRANFRGLALNVDMSNPDEVESLIKMVRNIDIDLVAGGPPCQPFSRAGRAKIRSLVDQGVRDRNDQRKELWRSFVRVVLALRPRTVLMENVPDMAIADDLSVIREIAQMLEQNGYSVDYRLLDAWRCGVPQHRKRFILQARRDGVALNWPKPVHRIVTVYDAIGDLPRLGKGTGARQMSYLPDSQSEFAKMLSEESSGQFVYDHMTRPVRADDRQAFSLMTSKTLYSDLPQHLRRYRSDTFVDKYKRLAWDDLSRTITAHIAKDGYWYIHPEENRTLTVREAARIQTFPDHFRFSGTRSDAFRQIGNAVPPLLARSVATCLTPLSSSLSGSPLVLSNEVLRTVIARWALSDRSNRWWLYCGPQMTRDAAFVAALLDMHRMKNDSAAQLMVPLVGSGNLANLDQELDSMSFLTAARRSRLRKALDALRDDDYNIDNEKVASLLSDAQIGVYRLLMGENVLVLNEYVRRNVSILKGLPDHQTGLLTDIKVALSQLVANDDLASLRMGAIRVMSGAQVQMIVDEAMTYPTNTRFTEKWGDGRK